VFDPVVQDHPCTSAASSGLDDLIVLGGRNSECPVKRDGSLAADPNLLATAVVDAHIDPDDPATIDEVTLFESEIVRQLVEGSVGIEIRAAGPACGAGHGIFVDAGTRSKHPGVQRRLCVEGIEREGVDPGRVVLLGDRLDRR